MSGIIKGGLYELKLCSLASVAEEKSKQGKNVTAKRRIFGTSIEAFTADMSEVSFVTFFISLQQPPSLALLPQQDFSMTLSIDTQYTFEVLTPMTERTSENISAIFKSLLSICYINEVFKGLVLYTTFI
jgi:hypothetical protein